MRRDARAVREKLPRALILVAVSIVVVFAAAVAVEISHELGDAAQWTGDLDAVDVERRVAALDRYSLGTSRWPEPVPCAALSRRLRDTAVRRSALSALARVVRTGNCLDNVIDALVHGQIATTRALAARALGSAPHVALPLVEAPLVAAAARNDSSAIAAVVALGQLGDTATTVRLALRSAFRSGTKTLRAEALESLARVAESEEATPFIEAAIFDDSPQVRAAGITALALIGNRFPMTREIQRRVQSLVADSSLDVRDALRTAAVGLSEVMQSAAGRK